MIDIDGHGSASVRCCFEALAAPASGRGCASAHTVRGHPVSGRQRTPHAAKAGSSARGRGWAASFHGSRFVDPVDRMFGDLAQHRPQGFGVAAVVWPCRSGVEGGGALAAGIRAGEE